MIDLGFGSSPSPRQAQTDWEYLLREAEKENPRQICWLGLEWGEQSTESPQNPSAFPHSIHSKPGFLGSSAPGIALWQSWCPFQFGIFCQFNSQHFWAVPLSIPLGSWMEKPFPAFFPWNLWLI